MAQSDLLLPWLGALDNVLLGRRLRGERGGRRAARALLAEMGLAGSESLRPAALSGGMRQRVALARTLFEDRPIVLMDEPFAALDAITRTRLQDLAVARLGGRTVLLVTHDPLEAIPHRRPHRRDGRAPGARRRRAGAPPARRRATRPSPPSPRFTGG